MAIVPCYHKNEGAIFGCAQSGCEACMEYLLGRHEGLIHAVIRYLVLGGISYQEAVEEGRIGLWLAIRRYDPSRGVAFSSYAWKTIRGRLLDYLKKFGWSWAELAEELDGGDDVALAEAAWQEGQMAQFLREGLEALPARLKGVLEEIYGLGESPPLTMAEIGRRRGLTRERIRQLRNDGLARLRLPGVMGKVFELSERNQRQDYRRLRQLNQAWLVSRRRKK